MCSEYMKNYQDSDEYYVDTKIVYAILLGIMDRITDVDKKAYSMALLKSYIQLFKLKNSIKASYILSKVLNEKISFLEEYLITGVLFELSKSFKDESNMEKYRVFSEHMTKF
jgi:hypothetical protein